MKLKGVFGEEPIEKEFFLRLVKVNDYVELLHDGRIDVKQFH